MENKGRPQEKRNSRNAKEGRNKEEMNSYVYECKCFQQSLFIQNNIILFHHNIIQSFQQKIGVHDIINEFIDITKFYKILQKPF